MKAILFVAQNTEWCTLAVSLFNEEAQKVQLGWLAMVASGVTTSDVTTSDGCALILPENLPSGTDLITVVIEQQDNTQRLQALVKHLNGVKECWEVTSPDTAPSEFKNHINKLIIRLIIQGGRRPPVSSANQPDSGLCAVTASAKKNANVRVMRERGGRRGKTVTVVSGMPANDDELSQVCNELKRLCGCGGSIKDGAIEVQGDQVEKVMAALQNRGYRPKRKGG